MSKTYRTLAIPAEAFDAILTKIREVDSGLDKIAPPKLSKKFYETTYYTPGKRGMFGALPMILFPGSEVALLRERKKPKLTRRVVKKMIKRIR